MVQAPSVAGLAVVGLLLLALAFMVPKFARYRRNLVNASRVCELSPAAHVVTTKTPGHGGPIIEPQSAARHHVSLQAEIKNENPAAKMSNQELTVKSQRPLAPVNSPVSAGRIAYLRLRAQRARRRLNLSVFFLLCTAAAWGYQHVPGFGFPWGYALIPSALLLAVLVSGRMAAIAAKANDQRYFASLGAENRRNRQFEIPINALDDEGYLDDEYENFDEEVDLPYANDRIVIPVPATQLIPEADQRLAVLENLKDDPEFLETNWSLGTPQVPVKKSFKNRVSKAIKFEMAS